jgi:P-type Cu2+ transporter
MIVMTADTANPSDFGPQPRAGEIDYRAYVRTSGGRKQLELMVRGAKCGACLAKIEKAVAALPGVETARLNLSSGHFKATWSGGLGANRIASAITGEGYDVGPYDTSNATKAATAEEKRLLLAMGVAGFAMANIMLLSVSVWASAGEMGQNTRQLFHWVSGAIAVPAVLFAGRPFFGSAWRALSKRRANMDVPISLALVLALGISLWETWHHGPEAYFDASVMLLFFLLIGRFLDARLRRRAHAAANQLAALRAVTVRRQSDDGLLENVRAEAVMPGDTLVLSAGERAAVDFDVTEGTGQVDESLVTGESAPRQVGPGTRLYAGTVILDASLKGRAVAPAADSLLADIADMLETGEQRRSSYRRIADKAVSLYVPLVHTTAALTLIGWMLAGASARDAILIAVSTLIITCPCALALAAPVAQVVASGRLFRGGVYLKSGDALERLATADHIVFDKTGTLTLGRPELLPGDYSELDLADAASLARASRHPLSNALVNATCRGPLASEVREHKGAGLEGTLMDGTRARLGSAEWVGAPASEDERMSIWFAREGGPPVRFAFEDALSAEAEETISALKARGFGVEIVSGDRPGPVAEVAGRLGIDTWTAEAKPGEKAARLEALAAEGRKVMMIGDGLNDAGALSQAHSALAPGGAMDVSQSAADAVYSGKDLSSILTTIDTAKRARRTMLQNFGLAAGYNVIAVPIAVAGYASPLVAAIAMSASSLVVTLNALRQNVN